MFPRVLDMMRANVCTWDYVMTLHAEEEMMNDGLSIFDVEQGILTGEILERQRDRATSEWKYRVRGKTADGEVIEVIAKMSAAGKPVIITVYLT